MSVLGGLTAGHAQVEVTVDTFGSDTNRFAIEFVTIRNPGNSDDLTAAPYQLGGVSYYYRMGRYEISEDIVNKANVLGNLNIVVSNSGTNKPARMVTFLEAARFVNWLNVTAGYRPAYRFSAQGEWLLWPSEESWRVDQENRYRHKEAFYFIPSADEWYKAAYFDGTKYFRYPTGSNSAPAPVARGTEQGTAVYGQQEESGPADVNEAGGLSPYGTMAQGGNVWEWVETAFDGGNDTTDELLQVRGGRWSTVASTLRSSACNNARPWQGVTGTTGFRIAARAQVDPVPPELVLRRLPEAGALEFAWASESGVAYDVERGATPSGPYVTIETMSGTGGELRFVFRPNPDANGFYRVVATRVGL
ncbi:MAG: SUMF1/EgtB/PvdO family nonheme iron enzyme [Verrucomicrobiales bacterium]|nr:SUMF1/EgtB/PvdO family nonheme iron enzyme [Verrucomicrobiales bacterium]